MEITKIQTFLWLAFCLILAIIIQTHIYLVGDDSWLLHTTISLLHGGRYNQDFFETNPPMILYLYTPAILINKLFPISLISSFKTYIFAVAIFSIYVCNSLLKQIFAESNNNLRDSILIAIAFSLLLLPAGEFGEREHVMIILSLPYLLLTILRAQNKTGKLAWGILGVFAGLGFALKPYFLITPLLIEIYLIFKHKKLFFCLRPETIAIALVLIFYVISIVIFTSEYLSQTLPLVNDLYFPGLPIPFWKMLFTIPVASWWLLLACYVINKNIQLYREYDQVLMLAATGFTISFILQRALWYYHWLPALTMLTLLLTKMLASHWRQKKYVSQSILMWVVLIGFSGSGFCFTTFQNIYSTVSAKSHINTASVIIKQYANGGPVYFLYSFVNGAYPLIDYSNSSSASRFPGLVYLPGLVKKLANNPDPKTIKEKQWLIDAVVVDFYQHTPTLVFIDKQVRLDYFNNQAFNYLKFFSSDPRFAKLFTTCYAHLTDTRDFKVYQNKCLELPRS